MDFAITLIITNKVIKLFSNEKGLKPGVHNERYEKGVVGIQCVPGLLGRKSVRTLFRFRPEVIQLISTLAAQLGVNDHPHSGWLGFSAIGRKNKSASVLRSLQVVPGAKHPVCKQLINFLGIRFLPAKLTG